MKFTPSLITASILVALTIPMTGCGVLKTRSDVSNKKSAKTSEHAKLNSNSANDSSSNAPESELAANGSDQNPAQNSSPEAQDSISKDLAAMQAEYNTQPNSTEADGPVESIGSETNAPVSSTASAAKTTGQTDSNNSMNMNPANPLNPMNNAEYGAYPAAGARSISNAPMGQQGASTGNSELGVSNLQSLKGQTFEANYGNTKSQIFFESDRSIVISKETGKNQRSQERIAADISGVRPGVFMISGRGADQIAFTMIGDVEQGLVRTTTVSPDQAQMTKTGSFKKIR